MKKSFCLFWFCFLYSQLPAQFSVSSNGHYILKSGKPFYWLGDTAWELFHRLSREQADFYLQKRRDQGFTVVQAVALAELDGLDSANAYGDKPLISDDPTTPNEAYFKHVDFIIDKAAEYGLAIALLPTWGDKITLLWGKGPLIFNKTNAEIFGRWIGARYKDKKNIIWVLGGDRNPNGEHDIAIWRAMAKGIEEGVGDNTNVLMSFHPQPNNLGAGEFFFNDPWFDFNMFQNGHCRNAPVYENITRSYARSPSKPVIDGESLYEDHPVCFNAKDLGTSSAYDTRRNAYLDVFGGAFGNTYGCHDIWQFYSKDHQPVNGPHIYWQEALDLPGAGQMYFIRKLIESRPFLERIPDQSILIKGNLDAPERIQATRGEHYLMVYSSVGLPFTLALGKIKGKKLNGFWYDPRTGKSTGNFIMENKGEKKLTPPTTGYGQDWVLVLDDSDEKFSGFPRE